MDHRVQIQGNEKDIVIPFHYLDDMWHNKALLLDFTYRFDDLLDADMLKSSLERLMEMDGWRKLGGRVRINDLGKLEYHVPEKYDDERPGFLFHLESHKQSISQHPIASQMPRAKSVPSVFEDPIRFHSFAHPDHPQKMEDWTSSDRPPLSISVWTFTDATILTLSFSHTLFDAVGRQCLLKGWTAVLNGREHEVPPFVGFKDDPMDTFKDLSAAEKHVLHDQAIVDFGSRAGSLSANASKNVTRVIQLPNESVQRLVDRARDDIRQTSPTIEVPFLSEGDVLFAHWAKLVVSALDLPPDQKLSLNNVYNFSGLIDELVPPGSAFLGNLVSSICTFTTVKQLLGEPLGITALQLRNDLLQQRSPEQVKALIALHKTSMKILGRPPVFGSPDQMYVTWSNWHRARFYDFDFSGAVVRHGVSSDQRKNGAGRPSLISLTGHENGLQVTNGGSLMGRDAAGNWWIHWAMREEAWPTIEKGIQEMSTG